MSEPQNAKPSHGPIDIGTLLTIDVDAAIRKVSQAHLAGPWQVPAELVRRAIGDGASRVELRLERDSVVVLDDSDAPYVGIDYLKILLDRAAPAQLRQEHLAELEDGAELGVLSLVGSGAAWISSHAAFGGEEPGGEYWCSGMSRAVRMPSGARGDRLLPLVTPSGCRIELRGFRYDREAARRWLEDVCRFAPAEIIVNGQRLPKATDSALAMQPLDVSPDVDGLLMIPRQGDTARMWIVLNGVMLGHFAQTDTRIFEAFVEVNNVLRPGIPNMSALRGQFNAVFAEVVVKAQEPLQKLAAEIDKHPLRVQERIRYLLFRSARSVGSTGWEAQAPVLPALVDHGRTRTWLSEEQVRVLAAQEGSVPVIDPAEDAGRYVLPATPVLVLNRAERARVSERAHASYAPPPLRPGVGTALAEFREWLSRLGERAVGLMRALRPEPAWLPEEAHTPNHRAFAKELGEVLPDALEVAFCRGSGPVRRRGRQWFLPQDNPTVAAGLQAFARDPVWIYPVALALLEGRALPEDFAGDDWRDTVL